MRRNEPFGRSTPSQKLQTTQKSIIAKKDPGSSIHSIPGFLILLLELLLLRLSRQLELLRVFLHALNYDVRDVPDIHAEHFAAF